MPAPLEPDTTPEEHRQRALLLADLGRYDEAADEIAAGLSSAPQETALLATLARIHLAADQPAEAFAAADRAATVQPPALTALVVRAMALIDIRRYADAARDAGEILARWPDDAYAQRTGAALLSESRNGQEALNAAWNGVRVAPKEAEAHLVLAVVAARLRLFDLAQRAYGEALELDAAIGDAGQDVGIVRLERRRWAQALESLAEEASLDAPAAATGPDGEPPAGSPSAEPPAAGPGFDAYTEKETHAKDAYARIARPTRPVLDVSDEAAEGLRETVQFGAGGTLIAAVLTAAMTQISPGISRAWAGLIGVLVFVAVLFWLRSRLPEPVGVVLARLRAGNIRLAVSAYLLFMAPLFLLAYAVVGGLPTLIAAMVAAAVAELLAVLSRR
ncbi:membrane protein [Actinoplanes rectilineatus]|uniref:membrane protein n=1 Tax=Actinoplanes rectilineatus TaxID=113571 RepID=UPI0005F287F9|nr:membrane protein [Actinoplanes rectilineatus]